MPSEFWRPTTGMYHPAAPGIEVLTTDPNWYVMNAMGHMVPGPFPAAFRPAVHRALTWLNATPTGTHILWALHTNANPIGISPSIAGGNNVTINNANNSLNLVAHELLVGGIPGASTLLALTNTFGPMPGAAGGLMNFINNAPPWSLNGLPGRAGSFRSFLQSARDYANSWALLVDPRYFRWVDTNEGYRRNQLWLGGPWGIGGGVNITLPALNAWLGGAPLPVPFNVPATEQRIKLATIAALYAQSPSGPGSSAAIRWDINPGSQMNAARPPAIGLAHELLHAYFGVIGQQPGYEFGHFSTVLFEYRCVGLGPWDEGFPSENTLRQEWWPHASPLIPATDVLNRKVPPKRIMYN